MEQLHLFAAPTSRRTDPATSHAAARAATSLAAGDHADILRALSSGEALAPEQIADRIGHGDSVRVCRRMKELERLGQVIATNELHRNRSGRSARRYRHA